MSWTAVPGITKYAIFRKDLSDPEYQWESAGSSAAASFTDTQIAPERIYKYKIFSSLQQGGENLIDNEETAPEAQGYAKSGKNSSTSVPAKVIGLTAVFDFSSTPHSMRNYLEWTKIPDAVKYDIARFDDGYTLKIIGSAKNTSYNDYTDNRMSYAVRAVNTNGPGPWSDAASSDDTEYDKLMIPSGLSASSNQKDRIELKWYGVPRASYYILKRTHTKTKEKKEFRVKDTVYADSDITPGRIYHYSVMAGNDSEKTKYSSKVTGRTVKTQTAKEEQSEKSAFNDFIDSTLSKIRSSDSGVQSKFSRMLSLKKEESLAEFLNGSWSGKLWTGGKTTQEFQVKLKMDETKFDAEFIQGKTVKKISGTVMKGADFIEAEGFKMQKIFDRSAEVTINSNKIYPTNLELNFSKD